MDLSPSDLTPEERTLRARAAVNAMHAKNDVLVVSAPGRAAFLKRFEDEVDPDRQLPEAERQRRAEHAKRSYMQRLALRSVQARRRKEGAGDA